MCGDLPCEVIVWCAALLVPVVLVWAINRRRK